VELVALLTIGIRADNYNDDVWQLLAVTEDNLVGFAIGVRLYCACEYVRPGVLRVSKKTTASPFKVRWTFRALNSTRGEDGSHVGSNARTDDESGAVLILALVYIISVSLIVLALASWAMNDLNNTVIFKSISDTHLAVSSVTEVAIQNIRFTPDPSNPNPPNNSTTGWGTCWGPKVAPFTVSQLTIPGDPTVAVWCNTTTAFATAKTRTVTLEACLSTLTASSTTADITAAQTNCQLKPKLTAVVVFDDYPQQGAPGQQVQCNQGLGQCGEGMTLTSWLWG
jgi:hypothetical protein